MIALLVEGSEHHWYKVIDAVELEQLKVQGVVIIFLISVVLLLSKPDHNVLVNEGNHFDDKTVHNSVGVHEFLQYSIGDRCTVYISDFVISEVLKEHHHNQNDDGYC